MIDKRQFVTHKF